MQFSSINEFIEMGGYGFYVWLSFGAATVILIGLLVSSRAGHQQVISRIAQRIAREDKLRSARKKRNEQPNDLTKVAE